MWFLSVTDKFHALFIIFWAFWFIVGLSTLYFFLRYFHEQTTKIFYEDYGPGFKGVFYLGFVWGVRNIALGFIHFLTPDRGEMVHVKIFSLLLVDLIFLVINVSQMKQQFFICKMVQWIMVWMAGLRMIIIAIISLDIKISNGGKDYSALLSCIYSSLFILYILLWIIPMIDEIIVLIINITRKIWFKLLKARNSKLKLECPQSKAKKPNHIAKIT